MRWGSWGGDGWWESLGESGVCEGGYELVGSEGTCGARSTDLESSHHPSNPILDGKI